VRAQEPRAREAIEACRVIAVALFIASVILIGALVTAEWTAWDFLWADLGMMSGLLVLAALVVGAVVVSAPFALLVWVTR
jgi:hypothetical protein